MTLFSCLARLLPALRHVVHVFPLGPEKKRSARFLRHFWQGRYPALAGIDPVTLQLRLVLRGTILHGSMHGYKEGNPEVVIVVRVPSGKSGASCLPPAFVILCQNPHPGSSAVGDSLEASIERLALKVLVQVPHFVHPFPRFFEA
jgi:hypothetical protein